MLTVIKELHQKWHGILSRLGTFETQVSGIDALFIWQYVRHNPRYRCDYDWLGETMAASPTTLAEHPTFIPDDDVSVEIGHHWRLQPSPVNYDEVRLPEGFIFQLPSVREIDLAKLLSQKNLRERLYAEFVRVNALGAASDDTFIKSSCLTVTIPLPFSRTTALASIGKMIDERHALLAARLSEVLETKRDDLRVPGKALAHALENMTFHYFVENHFTTKAATKTYQEIFGVSNTLQAGQISRGHSHFLMLAGLSPWCFFLPAKK